MPEAPHSLYRIDGEHALDVRGQIWATVSNANPLGSGFPRGRAIAWSGWFGDGADAHACRFPRDFRAWTPPAWKALRERLDAWSMDAGDADALILRPHARHVLSDAQACSLLLREVADARIQILLDPVCMLEPAMLRDLKDHLGRVLELATWPRIAGVIISGADIREDSLLPGADGSDLPRDAVEASVITLAPRAARFYV